MQKLLLAYKTKQEGRPGRTVNKKNERQRNSRQNKTDKAEPEKYGRQKNGIFPIKKTRPGACLFVVRTGSAKNRCSVPGFPGKNRCCAAVCSNENRCSVSRFPAKNLCGVSVFSDKKRCCVSVFLRMARVSVFLCLFGAASVFLLEKTAAKVYN